MNANKKESSTISSNDDIKKGKKNTSLNKHHEQLIDELISWMKTIFEDLAMYLFLLFRSEYDENESLWEIYQLMNDENQNSFHCGNSPYIEDTDLKQLRINIKNTIDWLWIPMFNNKINGIIISTFVEDRISYYYFIEKRHNGKWLYPDTINSCLRFIHDNLFEINHRDSDEESDDHYDSLSDDWDKCVNKLDEWWKTVVLKIQIIPYRSTWSNVEFHYSPQHNDEDEDDDKNEDDGNE